jgi:hypothetical protein
MSDADVDQATMAVHRELLEVLNDIAGTHAAAVVGISLMADWVNDSLIPGRGPGAMTFMGHGDPNSSEAITWQSWEIVSMPVRLAPGGPVIRDLGRQWIVMVASQWNDVFRKRFATADAIALNDVKDAGMADINRIRNDIVHHDGIATARNCGRCELFRWFAPGDEVSPTMAHVAEFMDYMGLVHGTDSIGTNQPWKPFAGSATSDSDREGSEPRSPLRASDEAVMPELSEEELQQLVEVCRFLVNFLDQVTWKPADRLAQLVVRTLARARSTYEVIVALVEQGRTRQAAMLGTSLFEDMLVAHWLVIHSEDPDWLIRRFEEHAQSTLTGNVENPEGAEVDRVDSGGISDAEPGGDAHHGPTRSWWSEDRDGGALTTAELVRRLADAPRFRPRLRGAEPVLEQMSASQQYAWSGAMHHTANGLDVTVESAGAFPRSLGRSAPYLVLLTNYWTFGQLMFVTFEHDQLADALSDFEKLFYTGLAVFMATAEITAPWMDQVSDWADEVPDSGSPPS